MQTNSLRMVQPLGIKASFWKRVPSNPTLSAINLLISLDSGRETLDKQCKQEYDNVISKFIGWLLQNSACQVPCSVRAWTFL